MVEHWTLPNVNGLYEWVLCLCVLCTGLVPFHAYHMHYASLHFHYAINLSLFVVTLLVNASPFTNKIIKSVITMYTISMHLNSFESIWMHSAQCKVHSEFVSNNLACNWNWIYIKCWQSHETMYTVVLSTKPFLFLYCILDDGYCEHLLDGVLNFWYDHMLMLVYGSHLYYKFTYCIININEYFKHVMYRNRCSMSMHFTIWGFRLLIT